VELFEIGTSNNTAHALITMDRNLLQIITFSLVDLFATISSLKELSVTW
jgi:hypothetical protein